MLVNNFFYLSRITSVLRIDYTVGFYAMRQTKLEPICICFDDVCKLVVTYVTICPLSIATYVFIGLLQ